MLAVTYHVLVIRSPALEALQPELQHAHRLLVLSIDLGDFVAIERLHFLHSRLRVLFVVFGCSRWPHVAANAGRCDLPVRRTGPDVRFAGGFAARCAGWP